MERYSYPETLYKAPKIPDFSFFVERKRLSGPSLRRFFWTMKKWRVGPKDAPLLLAGITCQRFKQLSTRPEGRILKQDQLLRVTSIIAIDDALYKLLPRRQADKWVQMPSRDWRFRGRTPLSDMVDVGILTLWELRDQLEARASESGEAER
jgi:hypothetical protein